MASLGKSVEYALHCLVYLAPPAAPTGVTLARLAEFQGVSESYLAKVFARLSKAGLVRSAVGVGGGYELARPPAEITFWDVVVAVEGGFRLFECRNIRAGCVLYRDATSKPGWLVGGTCEIHAAMLEAEAEVERSLRGKTLAALVETLDAKVPTADRRAAAEWFRTSHGGNS